MKPFKIIYFGSPDFSAQILSSLLTRPLPSLKVVAVVTQPDKPTGRQKLPTPSPVAQLANIHHLPVFKPTELNSANLAHLQLLSPDLFLVVSYGKIIPKNWLSLPRIAPLNIHFSLLPKYRGALCVSQAIKNQDTKTGVTLMEMDEHLDHGPIIAQATQSISPTDNVATLTGKLTPKAIKLLQTSLPSYLAGHLQAQPQNHSLSTLTPTTASRTRQSAFVPWPQIKAALNGQQAAQTSALIRSLNPDPGAWTKIGDQELKLLEVSLDQANQLKIISVQAAGKTPITWTQFLAGHPNLY